MIIYGGILGFVILLITFISGILILKGKLSIKTHKILAIALLIIALIHGYFGISLLIK